MVFVDCLRAVAELARANRAFVSLPEGDLAAIVRHCEGEALSTGESPSERKLVERVAFIIPALARRLPWRADCMVQAMAAQRWLRRAGIASTMTIGVRKDVRDGFGAHAWLMVGDVIVTGGDISSYVVIETQTAQAERLTTGQ